MNISYHHVTASDYDETVLLRFNIAPEKKNSCILIDAGKGATLENILTPDDRLDAILLTHPHRDHYVSLAEVHREGAPVYVNESFEKIAPITLYEYDNYPQTLKSQIKGISNWTEIVPGLEVIPLPAGHCPAASAFAIRFKDTNTNRDWHYIISTGDFTLRSSGGFPGFDIPSNTDIGVAFVNSSTTENFESNLSAAVESITTQYLKGGKTLVTASSLLGVQLAYILSKHSEENALDMNLLLAGRCAKLYSNLGYDIDSVTPVAEFSSPEECLKTETVTISSPESPLQNSSTQRLLTEIQSDRNSSLIEILTGEPKREQKTKGFSARYKLSNHPSEEALKHTIKSLDAQHTILLHNTSDYPEAENWIEDGLVWGKNSPEEHELYHNGNWISPPWVDIPPINANRPGLQITGFNPSEINKTPVEPDQKTPIEKEGVENPLIKQS